MGKSFRQRLVQGELLLGSVVTLRSPEAAELLAAAGFDWLFIDAEHAPLSYSDWQAMMQAAGSAAACVVRLPALDEAAIKHALDSGAAGVLVPQVNTVAQARQAVRWSRYAPLGSRGVGVARALGYGFNVSTYLKEANDCTALIVQAESGEAAENIEEIVKVEGIDAVLIGPYDLSASLGHAGDLGHPLVRAAIARITAVCKAAGMTLGIFGMTAAAVQPFIEDGFTLIAAGVDTALLGEAARDLLGRLRPPAAIS